MSIPRVSMQHRETIWGVIRLTRPVFLFGGVLMFGLGTVLAVAAGARIDWPAAVLGQALVTSVQLVAQYTNEINDRAVDQINAPVRTWLTGGSGALPEGDVSVRTALRLQLGCALVASVLIAAIATVQPITDLIGLLALAGSYAYSAKPLALVGSGWGELEATLIVTALTPLLGFTLQGRSPSLAFGLALLPIGLAHFAMLVTFSMPDWGGDQRTGKRSLAVRAGLDVATWIVTACCLAGFLALLLLPTGEKSYAWLALPFVGAHLAVLWQTGRVDPEYRLPHPYLTVAALAQFVAVSLIQSIKPVLNLFPV